MSPLYDIRLNAAQKKALKLLAFGPLFRAFGKSWRAKTRATVLDATMQALKAEGLVQSFQWEGRKAFGTGMKITQRGREVLKLERA